MTLKLLPRLVQEHVARKIINGRMEAATVFVDISGFTQLTETLMRHDKDGAEALTRVLNDIFNPLVAEVYALGGFISNFAGDAFTALFPAGESEGIVSALHAAFLISKFFEEHKTVQTRYGSFEMGVKVGLSAGTVEWAIAGEEGLRAFYFRGPAIDACANAEHSASKGDVVADRRILASIHAHVTSEDVGPCAARIEPLSLPKRPAVRSRPIEEPDRGILKEFGLASVADLTGAGTLAEFRDVTCVFLSFEEPGDLDGLNRFVLEVLRLCRDYGGYFNKLDFGDKGGLMVIVFGAPVARENDTVRAADFVLALREAQRQTGPPVAWRAGVSVGTVYAGILGGEQRCEYTVIGDLVNLAARLMQKAPFNEVWVSGEAATALQHDYLLKDLGRFALKGKSGTFPVFRLESRCLRNAQTLFTGAFVGRSDELARLEGFLQPIFQGSFAGMIYIDGEAGMGKSRLVHELRKRIARTADLSWFTFPADEILRQSLNPFKRFVLTHFDQSRESTHDENRDRFDAIFDELVSNLSEEKQDLKAELQRTRTFLGALADLEWKGSLYEQVEEKLRFENTLIAFKTFLLAECSMRPVIAHIEDVHWLDAESQELVRLLARNTSGYPLCLLLTSRYRDDHSPFRITVDTDIPQNILDLNQLAPDAVRALAAQLLGSDVPAGLGDLLSRKTKGNPFFVEQLVLYLQERGVLTAQNARESWQLDRLEAVPSSINAILVARLDRLTAKVKATVQAASVLGQEFEIRLLAQMLKGDEELPEKVKEAQTQAIWSALSEIRYLFRHALLRDTAYGMQMRARLEELHGLAGEGIEHLYREDLSAYLPDLAYHFGKAGDAQRERVYSLQAGEQAAREFANRDALAFLGRALELTPEEDTETRFRILMELEKVHGLQADRQAQKEDIDALKALAESTDDSVREMEALLRLASYSELVGDPAATADSAQRVVELAVAAGSVENEANAHLCLGLSLYRTADFTQAHSHLTKGLCLAERIGGKSIMARAFNSLGNVYFSKRDLAEAMEAYEKSLALFRELGNRRYIAHLLNNLGLVYMDRADFAESKRMYEEGISQGRAIGDRALVAALLNNRGKLAFMQNDMASAREIYEECLALGRELGDPMNVSRALTNLGGLAYMQGDYTRARHLLEETLIIQRKVGDKRELARSTFNLGDVSCCAGEFDAALGYYREGLNLSYGVGDKYLVVCCLLGLASLSAREAEASQEAEPARRAARLSAASDAILSAIGCVMEPSMRDIFDKAVGGARAVLDSASYQTAWEEGKRMSIEQLIPYALDNG